MARVAGGIAGWIAGVLPLAAVNALSYVGVFDTQQDATLAGAGALLGGLCLGGIVAGMLGTRGRRSRATGAALQAGLIAAILYAATLVGAMVYASASGTLPRALAGHLLRLSVAVLFVAGLLLAVALLTGTLRRRPAPQVEMTYTPVQPTLKLPARSVGADSQPRAYPSRATQPRTPSSRPLYTGVTSSPVRPGQTRPHRPSERGR